MEQYVGLDVSQQTTHLCVIDNNGKAMWRGQCASTPEAIAKTIQTKARMLPASGWRAARFRLGIGMR